MLKVLFWSLIYKFYINNTIINCLNLSTISTPYFPGNCHGGGVIYWEIPCNLCNLFNLCNLLLGELRRACCSRIKLNKGVEHFTGVLSSDGSPSPIVTTHTGGRASSRNIVTRLFSNIIYSIKVKWEFNIFSGSMKKSHVIQLENWSAGVGKRLGFLILNSYWFLPYNINIISCFNFTLTMFVRRFGL